MTQVSLEQFHRPRRRGYQPKTERRWGVMWNYIRTWLEQSRKPIRARDLVPQFTYDRAVDNLNKMHHRGVLVVVDKPVFGRGGMPASFKLKNR